MSRRSGVSLSHFYTFKTCGPSRASMLTGRYPFHFGIYSNHDIDSFGTPTNFSMIPALLKKAGNYATHAVGKWHCGYRSEGMMPTNRGFDTFLGYWRCCSDYWKHGLEEGIVDHVRATVTDGVHADREHDGQYSTFVYADEAVRIIRNHPAERPLYVALLA